MGIGASDEDTPMRLEVVHPDRFTGDLMCAFIDWPYPMLPPEGAFIEVGRADFYQVKRVVFHRWPRGSSGNEPPSPHIVVMATETEPGAAQQFPAAASTAGLTA